MTEHYTEAELVARVEGLTVTRLRKYTAERCIRPAMENGRPTYLDEDIARLRLLCELASDFDLDEETAAMVLSLLDQIHGLRAQLRSLAKAVAQEPEDVRRRIVTHALSGPADRTGG